MEQKYLNEEKTLEGMVKFIREKGNKHCRNGWNYITNEVVYAWAIMYFSLPNSFLKITGEKEKKAEPKQTNTKNNVVSLDKAKQELEKKKEVTQLSFFGGVAQ